MLALINTIKTQIIYIYAADFTMTAGFLIYYFFRNSNILIYNWFPFLPVNNVIITISGKTLLADFFRFNVPGGLMILSGSRHLGTTN